MKTIASGLFVVAVGAVLFLGAQAAQGQTWHYNHTEQTNSEWWLTLEGGSNWSSHFEMGKGDYYPSTRVTRVSGDKIYFRWEWQEYIGLGWIDQYYSHVDWTPTEGSMSGENVARQNAPTERMATTTTTTVSPPRHYDLRGQTHHRSSVFGWLGWTLET